jgi:hypothetical protein
MALRQFQGSSAAESLILLSASGQTRNLLDNQLKFR